MKENHKINAAITATACLLGVVSGVALLIGLIVLIVKYGAAWMVLLIPAAFVWLAAYSTEMRDLRRGDGIKWIE